MNPIALTLNNWWSYDRVDVEFRGDVIGIIGQNGSGKSTLVEALVYLMTGRSDRKKERNLKWGTEKGSVVGICEHQGRRFKISRDIVKSSASLDFGDGEKISSSADVNQALKDMLGISPNVFDGHVIVRQGHLDDPLRMQHAVLSSDFQQLFGTSRCEMIRDILQSRLNECPEIELGNQLEVARTKVDALKSEITKLRDVVRTLAQQKTGVDVDALMLALSNYKLWQTNAPLHAQLSAQIEASTAECGKLKSAVEEAEADYQKLVAAEKEFAPIIEQTADIVDRYRLSENARKQLADEQATVERLDKELEELMGKLGALQKPLESTDELELQLSETLSRLTTARRNHKRFSELNTVCPTCDQPVANRDELIQRHKAEIDALTPEYDGLVARITAMKAAQRSYDQSKIAIDMKISNAKALRSTAHARFLNHKAVIVGASIPDDFNLDDSNALLAEFRDLQKQVSDSKTSVATHKQALAVRQARLSADSMSLEKLTIPETVISDEDAVIIQQQLDEHAKLSHQQLEFQASLQVKQNQLDELLIDIDRMQAQAQQADARKSYRELLSRSRNLLHRDGLPRLIARSYLRQMNHSLSRILNKLNFPFTAGVQDDLSFLFKSGDGYDVFSNELSGGQRIMFCIAFRLAVNEQFARHLGLLILDEPTPYVDAENVAIFAKVLEEVRHYARSAGMKIIVVTHENALRPAFDQIIDVAELKRLSRARN